MDAIHKFLTFLTNPLTLGLAWLLVVISCHWLADRKKVNHHCIPTPIYYAIFILWLWLWSTPMMTRCLGLPLEREYPPRLAEKYPEADAICMLGGGMGVNTKTCVYPEMWSNADRVWHAARLYKAGKAKMITITGFDAWASTAPLLQDFGVPTNAIVSIDGAKNTEDEARLIGEMFCRVEMEKCRTRVLLVTSAWHMRRAEWLFKKAGLKVIPAACDYEVSARHAGKTMGAGDFLPDAEVLFRNSYLWKEHFAYWCYRIRDLF